MKPFLSFRFVLVLVLLALPLSSVALAQTSDPEVVGEEITWRSASPTIDSRDLAAGERGEELLVWSETLTFPGASYIAPHFSHLDLPAGARVVVTAPDGSRSWEYRGTGKADLGVTGGFWGIHIAGDTALVELWSSRPVADGAVAIDRFARGFEHADFGIVGGGVVTDGLGDTEDTEAICGADDSDWAKCYQTSEPAAYAKGRAVARLLINGINACTGWLVGTDGHLMTNEHCIGSAAAAMNTDYEFMAEGATCATNCASWFGCPGNVVANSATLVQLDAGLDYALVKLPTNPTANYGYLQLRNRGTYAGERIYIPQHPAAWGKRIAVFSTHPDDETGYCEVQSTTRPACTGGPVSDIGYYCDTQGGSSGSPVLGRCDNLVVALHHCAFCPNRGVPIEAIIRDLGENLPPGALGSSWGCGDCGAGYCTKGGEFCDTDGCYPADSPISIIVCQCKLLDPTCGFGGCVGNAYCEGPNCPAPVCYAAGTPWSRVMCEGWNIDPETCEVSP